MQYPYLISLETITLLLALFIGTPILYFLIRLFNKTIKFLTVLKAILLYEFCATLFYSIFSETFSLHTYPRIYFYLKILEFLAFGIILFFTFYFITKKRFLIGWKKSLILFLLMVVLLFPALDFLRFSFASKIQKSQIFIEELSDLKSKTKAGIDIYEPSSLKILAKIEGGTLSWFIHYMREIAIILHTTRVYEQSIFP
ncbi:MAG: hypothetical protein Q8P63_01165 [Candidatus Nealsonbacteria bacterium]|nr:hypothetical protein [Candidatus Nealsonbacteria bacterium]